MDIKNENIKIKGVKKDNYFKVPEGYFENFPERINKRIAGQKKLSPRRQFFLQPQIRIAAAAVVVLVLFLTLFDRNILVNDKDYEIEEIINMYTVDIDENLILSFIAEETNLYNEEESSDELIEYLLDEGIGINEILNALE